MPQCEQCTIGSVGDLGGPLLNGRLSDLSWHKYGSLSISPTLHIQRDGSGGGSVIVKLPLPPLRNLSPRPTPNCDRFGGGLSIYHPLYCRKGGLVTTCHNYIRDRFTDLSRKALSPSRVCDNLLVYPGCVVREVNFQLTRSPVTNNPPVLQEKLDQKGFLLILDLFQRRMDSIHDMRVVGDYTLSYHNKSLEKFLLTEEK